MCAPHEIVSCSGIFGSHGADVSRIWIVSSGVIDGENLSLSIVIIVCHFWSQLGPISVTISGPSASSCVRTLVQKAHTYASIPWHESCSLVCIESVPT